MSKEDLDRLFSIWDATYRYRLEGKGKEVLLLLHGFTGSLHTWDALVEALADRFTLIRLDLPGHGKTVTGSGRSMEAFAADLEALLSFLEVEQCRMLGYSLGGRTALSFAQFYPERVKALILESASPGLATEVERQARMEKDHALAEKILTQGLPSFVEAWENIPLFASQKALPEEVQARIRRERLSQQEEGLALSLRTMGTGVQPSWWEALREMEIPVSLIVGALDEKFLSLNQAMHERLVNSNLSLVEDAGHCVHVEQVEKFVKIVMEQ